MWPVYEGYEVERGESGKLERSDRIVAPASRLREILVREEQGRWVENDARRQVYEARWWGGDKENDARWYAPLRRPELLLRLAEIGESGWLTAERMRTAWAQEFGLLGVSDGTGRSESLLEFAIAAKTVSRTLRLYEAATAFGGPDAKALERYKIRGRTGRHLKEAALDEVERNVADHLRNRTYPMPYRLVSKETGEIVGHDEGRGFDSLLGAAYILMLWLMTAGSAARRCKRQGCARVITFEVSEREGFENPTTNPKTGHSYKRGPYKTRADKEFCGKACYRNWRYHNVEKRGEQRQG